MYKHVGLCYNSIINHGDYIMQYTYDSNIVSDLHKEAYGFRPRQGFMESWNDMRPYEKQETWDSLIADMEASYDREEQLEAEALVDFKGQIKAVMTICNCDWKSAVTHLQDADGEKDIEHFLWKQGIGIRMMQKITKKLKV